jgi:hypothetical protein
VIIDILVSVVLECMLNSVCQDCEKLVAVYCIRWICQDYDRSVALLIEHTLDISGL